MISAESTPIVAAVCSLFVVIFGCSQPAQEVVEEPTDVRSASMGLVVAALPPAFTVVSSDGPTIELERSDEQGTAQLSIEATGDQPGGINLVAEAEAMKEWFEQQPDGQFFGNLELGTPFGPAFTARGAYAVDGERIEQLRVFALHPAQERMLRLTYSYPPGTGKERLQQLAEVLGEIEPLPQNAPDN